MMNWLTQKVKFFLALFKHISRSKLGNRCFQKHTEAETNGCHFPDDISKCICLNENVSTPIKISLKFVSNSTINNISALVQIMACCLPGDKPLSEPMMVSLLTHICFTQPQWDNGLLLIWCQAIISTHANVSSGCYTNKTSLSQLSTGSNQPSMS